MIDAAQPALIAVRRAEGNVADITNLQRIEFSYGLPTANLVGGFTIEGTGVLGFDFYGEWDRNKRYFQFPNAALFNEGEEHAVSLRGVRRLVLQCLAQCVPLLFLRRSLRH